MHPSYRRVLTVLAAFGTDYPLLLMRTATPVVPSLRNS